MDETNSQIKKIKVKYLGEKKKDKLNECVSFWEKKKKKEGKTVVFLAISDIRH